MPNSISFQDFTPNVAATYSATDVQETSNLDLINHRLNRVKNYAAIDGMGIYLNDETLRFVSTASENIGAVSSTVTVENGRWSGTRPKITINLSNIYDLTKGITIWQHSLRDFCDEMLIIYYDANNEELTRQVSVYEEQDGRPYNYATLIGYSVKKVTIEPNSFSKTVTGYSTLKIDGLDFGTSVVIDSIVGDISVYGEIKLTKDDLPGCSCELTVLSDFVTPEEGQLFDLNCDSYGGSFIIDNVSRQGKNLYQISGTDITVKLDEFLINSTADDIDYGGYLSLLRGTGVSWSDEIRKDVKGVFKSGTTSRQALAMYCAAANVYVSAWKDRDGIHAFTIRNAVKEIIGRDRIFGNASYEKINPYKGVFFEIEAYGTKHITTLLSGVAQNNSVGYYKVSDITLVDNSDSYIADGGQKRTVDHIRQYLNGNEVTADIIYDGENLGDIVEIETPYDGRKTVVIKSIEMTIGSNSTIATIVGKEVT